MMPGQMRAAQPSVPTSSDPLIEKKYGTDKAIPQMILAGASCDDIFVIVLFTTMDIGIFTKSMT